MMNVLIVVDMQKDFVDGALGTAEAVEIIPAVVEKIRLYAQRGDVIIATRDTHGEDYLSTQEGRNLPVTHCVLGTPGWQLDAAVAAALPENAILLNKPTFGSADLPEVLRPFVEEAGEENVHVEIIGLCTDICVVSNALLIKAFYREMPVSLDSACCAGVTPEKHAAALETMRSCQIAVL
ncbi:MAG: cysteine hydrolase [Oscillospiraceae bacterium]|nr:cysteine hydrolase [Oscillospiraceae bacterium]